MPAVLLIATLLLPFPTTKKGDAGDPDTDAAVYGLVLEARLVGVTGARRLSFWPDRQHGVEPGTPDILAVGVGGFAHLVHAPLSFVLRVDIAEPTRPTLPQDRSVMAVIDAVVDDAYALWRPDGAWRVVAGRARVPFTRPRHVDDQEQVLGSAPFLVDRIAPDRRWGVTGLSSMGAFRLAAGAYADFDSLETRAFEDPSRGGQLAFTAATVWSPWGARVGHEEPFFGASELSGYPGAGTTLDVGAGVLVRTREEGDPRLDASLSVEWAHRFVALRVEGIASREAGATHLGAYGELTFVPTEQLAFTARGEWDGESGPAGHWTAGGGVLFFATPDKRNQVGFVGWFRRDARHDTPFDAGIVYLQASL